MIESGRVTCYDRQGLKIRELSEPIRRLQSVPKLSKMILESENRLTNVTRFRNRQRRFVHDGLVYRLDQTALLQDIQ